MQDRNMYINYRFIHNIHIILYYSTLLEFRVVTKECYFEEHCCNNYYNNILVKIKYFYHFD